VTATLWIGFGFLALLVIFLMCSFFLRPRLTDDQRTILKFLTALCAGFSGGFFTGTALFEMHKTVGSTTFGISGAAGCALFFVVWFFYPKVFQLQDGFEFGIPNGWSFRDTADRMTETRNRVVEYNGFRPEELGAAMQNRRITSASLTEGIKQLRLVTVVAGSVRPYDVVEQGTIYSLTIRERQK
jgi:hypothetical protein